MSNSVDRGVKGVLAREIPVRVRDVSLTGCLLEAPSEVHRASTGELRLRLAGSDYWDTVRVVRHHGPSDIRPSHLAAAEFAWRNPPGTCSLRAAVPELRRTHSSPILLPELRADELLLWRVRGEGRELSCVLRSHDMGLQVSVRDRETGAVVIEEAHRQLIRVVERAEQMRERCLAAGWRPISC